jgi:hypothetical protein
VKKLMCRRRAEDAYDSSWDANPWTKVEWWECWYSNTESPTGYGDTPGMARADLERQLRADDDA